MAYGISAMTPYGMSDLLDIRSLRQIRKFNISGAGGNMTISPGLSPTATLLVKPNDAGAPYNIVLDGNQLTWSENIGGYRIIDVTNDATVLVMDVA